MVDLSEIFGGRCEESEGESDGALSFDFDLEDGDGKRRRLDGEEDQLDGEWPPETRQQCSVSCMSFFESPTRDSADFAAALGETHRCEVSCQDACSRGGQSSKKDVAPADESLRSWLNEALSSDEPPPKLEKKKRGRKPLPMTPEERAEFVKKRNREQAQSTRRRQRMYVDYLKSQVATTTGDERPMCKVAALKFLELRSRGTRAEWRDIVAEGIVVTTPCEPFRELRGAITTDNRHKLTGVDAVVEDAASFRKFLEDLPHPVSLAYKVDPSEMMLYGDKLMCRWKLAARREAGEEHALEGMMRATFNRFCRIVDVDLVYDVAALAKALAAPGENLASPTAVTQLPNDDAAAANKNAVRLEHLPVLFSPNFQQPPAALRLPLPTNAPCLANLLLPVGLFPPNHPIQPVVVPVPPVLPPQPPLPPR